MRMSWSMASVVMLDGGMTPAMARVRASEAWMSASAGVIVRTVRYLCLKKTVLHVLVCFVLVM